MPQLMSIVIFASTKDVFKSSLGGIQTIFDEDPCQTESDILSKWEFALISDFYSCTYANYPADV